MATVRDKLVAKGVKLTDIDGVNIENIKIRESVVMVKTKKDGSKETYEGTE